MEQARYFGAVEEMQTNTGSSLKSLMQCGRGWCCVVSGVGWRRRIRIQNNWQGIDGQGISLILASCSTNFWLVYHKIYYGRLQVHDTEGQRQEVKKCISLRERLTSLQASESHLNAWCPQDRNLTVLTKKLNCIVGDQILAERQIWYRRPHGNRWGKCSLATRWRYLWTRQELRFLICVLYYWCHLI